MSQAEAAAQSAIQAFQRDVAIAKEQHDDLVCALEGELVGVCYELSERFSSFQDDLSADLGARAANECLSQADQDAAISLCEACCDERALVSACGAFSGAEQAKELIGRIVSESPVRDGLSVSRSA